MQEKAFLLMQLHSHNVKQLDKESFLHVVEDKGSLYGNILQNCMVKATIWYDVWKNEEFPVELFC